MSSTKKMKSDPRQTILVITVGMIVVYLAFQVKWALTASLAVGVLGLLVAVRGQRAVGLGVVLLHHLLPVDGQPLFSVCVYV